MCARLSYLFILIHEIAMHLFSLTFFSQNCITVIRSYIELPTAYHSSKANWIMSLIEPFTMNIICGNTNRQLLLKLFPNDSPCLWCIRPQLLSCSTCMYRIYITHSLRSHKSAPHVAQLININSVYVCTESTLSTPFASVCTASHSPQQPNMLNSLA